MHTCYVQAKEMSDPGFINVSVPKRSWKCWFTSRSSDCHAMEWLKAIDSAWQFELCSLSLSLLPSAGVSSGNIFSSCWNPVSREAGVQKWLDCSLVQGGIVWPTLVHNLHLVPYNTLRIPLTLFDFDFPMESCFFLQTFSILEKHPHRVRAGFELLFCVEWLSPIQFCKLVPLWTTSVVALCKWIKIKTLMSIVVVGCPILIRSYLHSAEPVHCRQPVRCQMLHCAPWFPWLCTQADHWLLC